MSQLVVSVPCETCSEPIRFGMDQCAACSAEVSKPLREALHARLEASDLDYRELMRHTRSARSILIILGAIHLLLAVANPLFGGGFTPVATSAALFYGLIAGVFFVLARVASSYAVLGLVSAVILWLAYNGWLISIDPRNIIDGIFLKVVSFTLLARGAVSANAARQTVNQMVGRGSRTPVQR